MTKSKKSKKICQWCREEFLTFQVEFSKFCCTDCREEFSRVFHQIYKIYPFDYERRIQETVRLKQLGKDYVLPEV
jgi:hypothetical protein